MAGRPREFDREKALVKARDFFWKHGYEGTSMSDLVEELGIASARIYKAFGSKEDLFREAVNHYKHHEGGFAVDALNAKDIKEAIRQLLYDALNLYTQIDHPFGCMVVSAANALSEQNQNLLVWMTAQRIERTEKIIQRFQQAKSDGQLSPNADPIMLGQYYALILHGLSTQARDGHPKEILLNVINFSLHNLAQNVI